MYVCVCVCVCVCPPRQARPLSKAQGEVDDLFDAVLKLFLCPSTRSAVGVCSTIAGRRRHPKFAEMMFGSRFSKSVGLAHGPLPAE